MGFNSGFKGLMFVFVHLTILYQLHTGYVLKQSVYGCVSEMWNEKVWAYIFGELEGKPREYLAELLDSDCNSGLRQYEKGVLMATTRSSFLCQRFVSIA